MLGFLNRAVTSDLAAGVTTAQIRDAAVRDLFALLGDPPPTDGDLEGEARRLLREHLAGVVRGGVDVAFSIPSATCNTSCLGTLEDLRAQLSQHGTIHAWGHFISPPRAHAETVGTLTAADGVTRVYMATAWRA